MIIKSKGVYPKTFEITDYTPLAGPVFDLGTLDPAIDNILQIDGGGIKGLIPSYWLYVMELASGKSVKSCFKTLWGTSTGSIIAALIARGFPMKEILQFYIEKGPLIFVRQSLFGLIKPKFNPENLEKELKIYFPDNMTFKQLFDESGIELNITVVDAVLRKTLVANYKKSPDMPVWKAVRASTSAPYYFGPFLDKGQYFADQKTGSNAYFDGGTGVFNNASEKAFNQAYYVKYNNDTGKFFLLSLGTGFDEYKQNSVEIKKTSGINQALWAFSYSRDESVSEQVENLEYLKIDLGLKYFRKDIKTPKELDPMDETKNIPKLLALVDKKDS